MSNVIQFPGSRAKLQVKDGKVVSTQYPEGRGKPTVTDNDDFGDRMQRIRQSLEKINQLMQDLKANSNSTKITGIDE